MTFVTKNYNLLKTRRNRAMQAHKSLYNLRDRNDDFSLSKYGVYKSTQSSNSISGTLGGHRSKRKITLPKMPWDNDDG